MLSAPDSRPKLTKEKARVARLDSREKLIVDPKLLFGRSPKSHGPPGKGGRAWGRGCLMVMAVVKAGNGSR